MMQYLNLQILFIVGLKYRFILIPKEDLARLSQLPAFIVSDSYHHKFPETKTRISEESNYSYSVIIHIHVQYGWIFNKISFAIITILFKSLLWGLE